MPCYFLLKGGHDIWGVRNYCNLAFSEVVVSVGEVCYSSVVRPQSFGEPVALISEP